MLSTEFVEPYRRSIPDAALHKFGHREIMDEARYWDNAYGEVLHDYLQTGQPVNTDGYHGDYLQFSHGKLATIPYEIAATEIDEGKQEQLYSELPFHFSNSALYPMWFPLQGEGTWKSFLGERKEAISFAQDSLAFEGLSLYIRREQAAGAKGKYEYFGPDYEMGRRYLEGIGSELDAALVALEAIKPFSDLTLVPGPRQFESDGARTKNIAADFVVVSTEGKSVGIQVKSSIYSQEKVDRYDPSRIVMIDARTDLGDRKTLRTQQESTKMRTVTWAGTLCALRATHVKFHGNNPYFRFVTNSGLSSPRELQNMKAHGKILTRGMRNDLPNATQIVRDRITRKLHEAPEKSSPTIIDMVGARIPTQPVVQ